MHSNPAMPRSASTSTVAWHVAFSTTKYTPAKLARSHSTVLVAKEGALLVVVVAVVVVAVAMVDVVVGSGAAEVDVASNIVLSAFACCLHKPSRGTQFFSL